MLALMIMVSFAAAEEAWFFPGSGPQRAIIAPDGTLDGIPVRRTGAIVARCDHPAALAALPWVAAVEPLGNGELLRIVTVAGTDELARSRWLRARGDVAWAHPDLAFSPVLHELPDDPYVAQQWHLENTGQGGWTAGVDIDAPTAWALATGVGGLIAVVDSGVDTEHPDLIVTAGWDYIGDDADSNPDPETDGSAAHGTCAAGVAAAAGDNGVGVAGVAYDAEIYGIRLIGGDTTYSDLYDTFVEATDAGAWVLSNSWGFGSDCPTFGIPATVQDALDYAEEHGRGGLGAAVVASAGNGDCDVSGDGFQAWHNVISVAASNGHDEREYYSSFGDVVDITAPSGGLLTTDISGGEGYGDYNGDADYIGWFSGTSAAAPVISGVLALMFEANPRLTAAQAREVLCDTAVRIDPGSYGYDETGWNPYYGCGRVDAAAAVFAVASEPPEAPELLGPALEAYADRVVLRWAPAHDADDDWLDYEVGWWIGHNSHDKTLEVTASTSLDITDRVEVGTTYGWQVTPRDSWGDGEPSAVGSFEVLAIPEPPEDPAGGCSSIPARRSSLGLLALLGLLGVRRARRAARPRA